MLNDEFEVIYNKDPFSMDKKEKEGLLIPYIKKLSKYHYNNCEKYKKIINAENLNISEVKSLADVPYLPVRLFKDYDLKSIEDDRLIKIMQSSGTTGSNKSRIYLDKVTAERQQRVMIKILSDFIGQSRMPMLIVDSPDVIRDRTKLAVRGAAILGFSIAGRDRFFALDNNMDVDLDGIREFVRKHANEKILIFGFTSMIWQYFYKALEDGELDLSDAILIHGGGWKKLIDEKVDNDEYKKALYRRFGIIKIHDYYGMVEQTGCIYMECEYGHLHVSNFSELIIRRSKDYSIADMGEEGIIQVISTIPLSYPGHSIMTEDKGILLGEDDCPCGRCGKYFKITGRIKMSEIRGCSDAY